MTRLEIAARIAAGLANSGKYLASDIARFSLKITDALIRLEAETRPKPEPETERELPFEMVVGGLYLDREGREEEIVGESKVGTFPFVGKSGRFYSLSGTVWGLRISNFDLIKRIR